MDNKVIEPGNGKSKDGVFVPTIQIGTQVIEGKNVIVVAVNQDTSIPKALAMMSNAMGQIASRVDVEYEPKNASKIKIFKKSPSFLRK